jgi:dTDP-4-amino-4,6-dideoxygalactose transaminase
MKVRFVDLRADYEEVGEEAQSALTSVVESGQFILGPAVERFEAAFAAACDARHCVGVSSGTEALKLSLEALGAGPGHEVILPVNTFAATALAVSALGARPRLVDCEEESHLLDPVAAERAITDRTRAILPVHLYGRMVDLAPLEELGVPIVEDAAQAHGAEVDGVRAGSRGAAGCFSFYPSKNLGAYGDAGAVVTSHEGLAEELRSLRQYGQSSKYQHERLGYNARLDSLQAAVLEVKLRHLDDGNRRRRAAAAFYSAGLKEGIGRPGPEGVFHLYVIRVHNRDQLQKELGEVGIETGIHYPIPLHLQPCFRDLGHAEGDFPVAERMAREILSLPIYPQIREDQLAYVVEQVNRLAEAP